MRISRNEAINLALLALCWLIVAWYWPHLPQQVPHHWGVMGQPNQWMPMPWGGLLPGLMALLIYLFMTAIPFIDPRAKRWESFKEFYPILKLLMMGFSVMLTYLTLSTAVTPGQILNLSKMLGFLGVFFILLGNYLPKVRSNFFIGIRTPWTLSSEEVWFHTHRLAGRLFVIAGILTIVALLFPPLWQAIIVIGSLVLVSIVTVIYSYWLYAHLPQGGNP